MGAGSRGRGAVEGAGSGERGAGGRRGSGEQGGGSGTFQALLLPAPCSLLRGVERVGGKPLTRRAGRGYARRESAPSRNLSPTPSRSRQVASAPCISWRARAGDG